MTEGINRVKQFFDNKREQAALNNAFRTKQGLDLKVSDSHSFKDDPTVYLKQVYAPDTWFSDIVNFGKFRLKSTGHEVLDKSIGYFMFVHANSRFIVLHTGNLIELDDDSSLRDPVTTSQELFEFTPTGLKTTQYFIEALTKLTSAYRCRTLITDFEPGWRSTVADTYYQQHGIRHIPINVSEYGHRKLAILDRAVRTIRDMIFNSKLDQSDPVQLQKLIDVYNK